MSDNTALYRRIRRRETRSSRSVLAIILAVVIILACAFAITEIILHLAGQPALVSDMYGAANATASLASYPAGIVIAAGVLTALIGLWIMIAALTAGRKARHVIDSPDSSIVVDNGVIASALARHAAYAGHVNPDDVSVSVSHRSAVIRMTPSSGIAVDKGQITTAAQQQLDTYGLTPKVRPRVVIDRAKVGS